MGRSISVVMAVDEQYTAPLCVTVASLLEHLRPGVGLELHLMSSGLTPETRRTLEGAWDDRVRLHWTPLDDQTVDALRGCGYTSSLAANFRLVVGSSLPADVAKVIYLDADLLIRSDLVEIWERDMRGDIVLAVQDCYVQQMPSSCRAPGAPADGPAPYFNSGVMVIDLAAWRAAGIEQSCLEAARRLRHRTKWLDQHVLNACLAGRWGALPPVWNKQFSLDLFPDWRCSPYNEREFEEARRRPAIIHFCTHTKPWHAFSDHPRNDVLAYRAALRATAFGGVPGVRPSLLRLALEILAAPHRRLLDTTAAAFHAKQRAHAIQAMLPAMLKLAILHPWTLATVPLAVVRERVAIRLGRLSASR
jgi:lipopolysaccharide biosynthesis glycosyltransferase